MSIYATIGDNEPAFFSSLQGWKEVSEWADQIDDDKYEDVVHLTEHGFTNDMQAMAGQLIEAMSEHPPSVEVSKTLLELLELVEGETGELIVNSGVEE